MTATGKKKNISIEKRRERTAYLFIAPAAILIIAFCIIPLIASFYISTQKMGVDLSAAEFIGFDNYKKIVGDRRFWQSVDIKIYRSRDSAADDNRCCAVCAFGKEYT